MVGPFSTRKTLLRYMEPQGALGNWCDGCDRMVSMEAPHDDDCPLEIERVAKAARARAQGDLPLRGYFMLYGLLICALVAGFVVWRMIG